MTILRESRIPGKGMEPMGRKIVLFELNEVPVRVFEHYVGTRPESALAQLLPQCRKYETFTEDRGSLEPWVTWPTLHRGVSNETHEIKNFGQSLTGQDREFPPIWKILAGRGVRTGVFGSLHSYPMPEDLSSYDYYVPDTFAAGSECFPADMSVFQEFNLRMARESGRNVSRRIAWQEALTLLVDVPKLGFKLETALDVGRQLWAENREPWTRTRRRSYQAVLAFDVFMKQLEQRRPDFTTFFTNHVASTMHRYWAAVFPGDYPDFACGPEWVATYRNEIDFTMGKFSQFLARLVRFVDRNPEYQIWVATSMGQAATQAKPCEYQIYLMQLERFMAAMGLEKEHWEERPAMRPQTNIRVNGEQVSQFRGKLESLRIEGNRIRYRESGGGFFSIDIGNPWRKDEPLVGELAGRAIELSELGIELVEIDDKANTSAYHIPQGTLLIYDPLEKSKKPGYTQINSKELAPTILRNYGVLAPGYMMPAAPLAA
ncbi:MAG: hypothetical protein ACK6DZ_01780 [Acidobacteriota bacterium]